MKKLFNKILVPVDFSTRSKNVMEKAVDIALQYECGIHLIHATRATTFPMVSMIDWYASFSYNTFYVREEIEFQLQKIQKQVKEISNGKILVDYTIMDGAWDDCIIDFVNKNNFDLVLIGQKPKFMSRHKMTINPDKIASNTDVAVISFPSNRRLTRLYSIVIPITDFLPIRKLTYAVYMGSKFNTTIKLLGVQNAATEEKTRTYLQKAYELMHDICNVNVEQEMIEHENIAEAINEFSKKHSADLVIVNPITQTKMPGFLSSFFGNIIQRYSLPPVLTVNAGFRLL